MTKAKLTVRYTSGREDKFEIEVYGGAATDLRLQDFVADPTLVLQTEAEVIIIPANAIEKLILSLPPSGREQVQLPSVRQAKKLS